MENKELQEMKNGTAILGRQTDLLSYRLVILWS